MTLSRILIATWLLAVGFVVTGLALRPKVGEQKWVLAGFLICCGCFIAFQSSHALLTSRIHGRYWTVTRDGNPASFWLVVVVGFLASLALFIGAVAL